MRSTLCVLLFACGAAPTLADGGEEADAAAPVDDAGIVALCDGLPCDAVALVNLSYIYDRPTCGGQDRCHVSVKTDAGLALGMAERARAMGCIANIARSTEIDRPSVITINCDSVCATTIEAVACRPAILKCATYPTGAKPNACEWNP